MKPPRRILVRGPNWLGDLVMATPGFRALRRVFPDAEIALHARGAHLALLSGSPWFDHLVPVASYHRGVASMLREAFVLRGRHYDLGVCLPESTSAALLMRATGAARVVGYARPGARWLLDTAPPAPPPMTPRERHVLGVARAASDAAQAEVVDWDDTRVELFVDDEGEARATQLAREAELAPSDPLALLAPGASYGPSKCWPPESFASLADALDRDGVRVAVVGAPEERPLAERVTAAARSRPVDWCGRFDLRTLKAVVRRARLLVCNDAGARHVAVALGVPCVAIFGPTSVEKTALNLERVRVFESEVGCRPCYHRHCPIDHRCMHEVSPRAVLRAARETLAAGAPAR